MRISPERFAKAQAAEFSSWQDRATDDEHIRYELGEHSEVAAPLRKLFPQRFFERGLDVGIGPWALGFLAVHFPDRVKRIDGLDPLPGIDLEIRDGQLQAEIDAIRARVNYIRGRGEEIPVRSGTYDIVACINVVDHAQEPPKIVAECVRVLKPSGVLVFGVNTLSVLGEFVWKFRCFLRRDDWFYLAHPHTFLWSRADRLLRRGSAGATSLWTNKPSLWRRIAGHGRMSYWILQIPRCRSH